ncbi:FtsQ-type POTRA domain-containing protein [Microbacterium sp. SYP-A9085]|uniref:FtsQ-type POTRA domain-containing protein n=1 Tax=Microbacterium sp. SYP-A9085 TaxID=2664454 RepID=UPI001323FDA4|nr:FtsQ-type POTRA domain-containing protein [Microbacterium sp. SYP-A9085]
MRRPTPLPAPPRTTPAHTAAHVAKPAPAAVQPGEDDEVRDAAPAALASVGVRDVWRAARARRRALRAEMRRFTARQRRRRATWAAVGTSLVLLVGGTFAAAYSPLFAVERISVVGTRSLDAGAVQKALDAQLGTPLPLVDASTVKVALVAFPLVETYSLEARPPHELVVRIVERTPVGVVKGRAGYTLVDAAGVALSTTASAPKGQPVLTISGGVDSAAFRSAGQVVRALPGGIRSQLTAVKATTPDDVTLTLGKTGTKVVWGSADDSAMKALVLQKLMKKLPPSKVSSYDVSSPGAAVVR